MTSSYNFIRLLSTLSRAQPDKCHNMILRLGEMRFLHELHWLRKITDGRKWSGRSCRVLFVVSINVRALRLLVETVIQNTVQEANDDDDLISRLQYHATSSTTTNVWADGLIH